MKRGRGKPFRKKNQNKQHKRRRYDSEDHNEEPKTQAKLKPEIKESSDSESSEGEETYYNQLLSFVGTNKEESESEEEVSEGDGEELEEEDGIGEEVAEDEGDSEGDVEEEQDGSDAELDDQEEEDDVENEESADESESENENEDAVGATKEADPFHIHLGYQLPENFVTKGIERENYTTKQLKWPQLGQINLTLAENSFLYPPEESALGDLDERPTVKITSRKVTEKPVKSLSELSVKSQLTSNCTNINKFQLELLSLFSSYIDFYYPERNFENGEDVRFAYCFHVLNHLLKSRSVVLHHNEKLKKKDYLEVPDSFRDQGLVRPKVLIVLPFKESALRTVKLLSTLLLGDDTGGNVINKKRFYEEFSEEESKKNIHKPEDYQQTFKGNTDDSFRIGMAITKKSLKLYTNFYASDIIIASPLGLRTIIGAEGEQDRDFDFLTSIEILIVDQTDVLMMQNWEHILHILSHLHLQPQDTHGTDLSRVRMFALDGLSKYFRQTLLFGPVVRPEVNAIINKHCFNYFGKGVVFNKVERGTVGHVVVQLPQAFHKIEAVSPVEATEARFEYFVSKILPQFKDGLMKHTLIFVPSYFDYVRLRNYFKKEEINFTQICEYSEEGKIAKARDMFFHGKRHFLLYTGRCHFYKRFRIKGIRHIIFYELPTQPNFYSELCNFCSDLYQGKKSSSSEHKSCTVLYSKFDVLALANVVGSDRARQMATSDRKVHMLVTSDA